MLVYLHSAGNNVSHANTYCQQNRLLFGNVQHEKVGEHCLVFIEVISLCRIMLAIDVVRTDRQSIAVCCIWQ